MLKVRLQEKKDQAVVIGIIREAFWNLYQPGADRHFIYTLIKQSSYLVPQLTLVAQLNETVVGQIVAYRTTIRDHHQEYDAVTFGPVSVKPQNKGQGIGQYLIKEFLAKAKEIGFKVVIIQGYPHFYNKLGFRNSQQYEIKDQQGHFSAGLLVYELQQGYLKDKKGNFINKMGFFLEMNNEQLQTFEKSFPFKQKFKTRSQINFMKMLKLKQGDPYPLEMWDTQRYEK